MKNTDENNPDRASDRDRTAAASARMPTGFDTSDIDTEEPSLTNALTAPTAPSRRTNAAIQPHQRHFLAKAAVQGLSISEMALAVNHTPHYVKELLDTDEDLIALVAHYRHITINAMVEYKVRFMEMVPQALAVVETQLVGDDKARQWAADKVFKEIQSVQGPSVEINLAAGVDPEEQKVVNEAIEGITKLLTDIKDNHHDILPMERFIKTTIPGPEDVIGHSKRHQNDSDD